MTAALLLLWDSRGARRRGYGAIEELKQESYSMKITYKKHRVRVKMSKESRANLKKLISGGHKVQLSSKQYTSLGKAPTCKLIAQNGDSCGQPDESGDSPSQ